MAEEQILGVNSAYVNRAHPRRGTHLLPVWLAVAAVVVLGANLRPGATSVGPLLAELRAGLGMDDGVAALLNAVPPFCFALFGVVAARIGARLGTSRALAGCAALITVGLAARVLVGGGLSFLVFTVMALAGMAVGNVLVPVFVKRFFPSHVAPMMSVYTTMLPVGALAPSLMVPLIFALRPGDWRLNLGVWAITSGAALVIWLIVARLAPHASPVHESASLPPRTGGPSMWQIARTRKGFALGVFFGFQSMQAYVAFGWLPQIFRDAGLSATQASLLLALYNVLSIPGGVIMPIIAQRLARPAPLVLGLGGCLTAGYVGLLVSPGSVPWLWVVLLSLSGWAFALAITLLGERTRSPLVTAQLSGFAQSFGYLIAGTGTWLVGVVHGATNGWTLPLVALIGSAVVFTVSGMLASARGDVDDQLS